MSQKYSISVTDQADVRELKFSGDLIINHIENIYGELQELITPEQSVTFILDNPNNIDITFLQLIESVRNTWAEHGKEFKIQTTLADDLKQLVAKAGLEANMNFQ